MVPKKPKKATYMISAFEARFVSQKHVLRAGVKKSEI